MRLILDDKVHVNSHVSKLGWTYPIMIISKKQFNEALHMLQKTAFGSAAKQYHFYTPAYSTKPDVKRVFAKDNPLSRRYYADNRLWSSRGSRANYDFWLVFKTDQDRTMALMTLS
jgi:hypothetical protein